MARRNDYKRVDSLLKSLLGDESNAEISSRVTNAYYKKLSQAKQFPFAKDALNVDLANFASLPVWTQLTLEAEIAVLAGKLGAVLNKNVVASVMDSFKTLDKPPNVAGFNHSMSYIATIFLASASWAKIALELKQEFAKSNATGPAVYRYILKYLHRTYGKDYHESAEVAAKILNGNKADDAGAVDAGPAVVDAAGDDVPPLIEFDEGPPIGPINVVTPAAGDAGAIDDTVANTPGAGDDLNASFVNEKDEKEEEERDEEPEETKAGDEGEQEKPKKLTKRDKFYDNFLDGGVMRLFAKDMQGLGTAFESRDKGLVDKRLRAAVVDVNGISKLHDAVCDGIDYLAQARKIDPARAFPVYFEYFGSLKTIRPNIDARDDLFAASNQFFELLEQAGYTDRIHNFIMANINKERETSIDAGDAEIVEPTFGNGLGKRKRARPVTKTQASAKSNFVSRTPLVTKAKAIEILQGEIDAGNNNPLLQLTLRKLKSS